MTVSSTRVLHPKCGKYFGNSNTEGHCAACCETFMGLQAFDRHRSKGTCLKPTDGQAQFWIDDQERWHWGPKMGPELKLKFARAKL